MQLIDTHCHLDVSPLFPKLETVLHRARAAGVQEFIVPGVDRANWQRLMTLANQKPGVYAAPGLHPMYLAAHRPTDLEELASLTRTGQLLALGEIGLDYFINQLDRQAQQQLFEQQLALAKQAQLPVLLHCRKAHDQVLATLRRMRFPHGGIVHAYGGSLQQAREYIKLGFGLGVGGVITYDRATKVRKNCLELPLEWLVLETDAPDIPLAGHREEPCNLPEYLPEVLLVLAKVRGEDPASLAAATTANARRILPLCRPGSQ